MLEMGMCVDLWLLCMSRKCPETSLGQIIEYFIGHSKKIGVYFINDDEPLQIFKHSRAHSDLYFL